MLKILDLGTGTGCLLLALLSELPRAEGLGIDAQSGAVAIARANAEALGLGARARFRTGDWGQGIGEQFDVILSIRLMCRRRRSHGWSRRSPASIPGWRSRRERRPRCLVRSPCSCPICWRGEGRAFIELGFGQAAAATRLFEAGGLQAVDCRSDLAGIPRCLVLGQQKRGWKSPCDRLG